MEVTLMLALAALLIGLSKGGLGGPVPGSMAAPLLTLVMPSTDAVGIVLPMLLFADMLALRMYWRCWSARYLRLMLPAAVLGIITGTMVLLAIPDASLRRVIGAFTLLMIAYKLIGSRAYHLRYRPRPWHGALAGWGSAFGAALANSGAAPYTAYMLLQPDVQPRIFVGTATFFFFLLNALKIPGYLGGGVLRIEDIRPIAWVFALIPLGFALSYFGLRRIHAAAFERLMLILLGLLGLFLLSS